MSVDKVGLDNHSPGRGTAGREDRIAVWRKRRRTIVRRPGTTPGAKIWNVGGAAVGLTPSSVDMATQGMAQSNAKRVRTSRFSMDIMKTPETL